VHEEDVTHSLTLSDVGDASIPHTGGSSAHSLGTEPLIAVRPASVISSTKKRPSDSSWATFVKQDFGLTSTSASDSLPTSFVVIPTLSICPFCHKPNRFKVDNHMSNKGYWWAVVLGLICLCWVPYAIGGCRETETVCSSCGAPVSYVNRGRRQTTIIVPRRMSTQPSTDTTDV